MKKRISVKMCCIDSAGSSICWLLVFVWKSISKDVRFMVKPKIGIRRGSALSVRMVISLEIRLALST